MWIAARVKMARTAKQDPVSKAKQQLERWLSSEEHLLLFQGTWVGVSAPTQ